jgi:hypothetical protein
VHGPGPTPLACHPEEIVSPRSSADANEAEISVVPDSCAVVETNLRLTTRSKHGIKRPKVYTDGTICYGCFTSSGEPHNLEEALDSKNWKHAMYLEFSALMNNKTWHLVLYQKEKYHRLQMGI